MSPVGDFGGGLVKLGYARVSTIDQRLDLQIDALKADGCGEVFTDMMSGSIADRPGLEKALARLGPGVVLVIWKLDRIGRSLSNLVQLVETIQRRGAHLRVLTGGVDTTTKEGRLIFGIMATLAEYERALIQERVCAGLAAAKRKGVKLGPPEKMSLDKIAAAKAMAAGGMMQKAIANALDVDRSTLWRALKRG